ncbi:beta-ketoacyl synthase N-terminal-like domain-containing protein [Teredinibacter sp. KSP-S5-2]|uniref:beta-ketoacyl synthase N-terminal-like domain-containing protein n=1 Tax=Teredinibacter sp. KSP-S5-2 TaxID=3034506 RepID=UPI002934E669|nr:beta-ketoacyl synthase N-terminal-like domain-containing protein [Teredinibacter sp. KSP-S5-2]WNO09233.1 beta-ketoacyl synthase N-terminal-like domain-containing protein [Teredinibacter sp. KSP-S5-2]
MSVYLHNAALKCSLGDTIQACTDNYLSYQNTPSDVVVADLNMPVTMPYFTFASSTDELPHERMYHVMDEQVRDAIELLNLSKTERQRTGLFLGSSSFSANHSEYSYAQELHQQATDPLILPNIGYGKITEDLRNKYDLSFHSYTYATACTSSANAMLYAKRFIDHGILDHAIVLGYEFYNNTTALGFYGLELISPSKSLRSFDARRDGLILGEGCATLCLSKQKKHSAIKIKGGAINTDSHSLTAANPDGSSIANVFEKALHSISAQQEEVVAVKTHGTASIMNDEAEAAGLLKYFTRTLPKLFAIKPYIGHTLGACGVLESILTTESLSRGIIPATPGLACATHADKKLGVTLAQENSNATPGLYLLNYFAFGGNNTVLVLEKEY